MTEARCPVISVVVDEKSGQELGEAPCILPMHQGHMHVGAYTAIPTHDAPWARTKNQDIDRVYVFCSMRGVGTWTGVSRAPWPASWLNRSSGGGKT